MMSPSKAASIIARKRTPKKARSARKNGKLGGRPPNAAK